MTIPMAILHTQRSMEINSESAGLKKGTQEIGGRRKQVHPPFALKVEECLTPSVYFCT